MEKAAFKVPHSSSTPLYPNEDFLLPFKADIDTGEEESLNVHRVDFTFHLVSKKRCVRAFF